MRDVLFGRLLGRGGQRLDVQLQRSPRLCGGLWCRTLADNRVGSLQTERASEQACRVSRQHSQQHRQSAANLKHAGMERLYLAREPPRGARS